MQSLRLPLAVLAAALVMGCDSTRTATPLDPTGATMSISDAVHNSGNQRFFFLPPVVPQPAFQGQPDQAAQPTVVVCELGPSGCVGIVAWFDMSGGVDGRRIEFHGAASDEDDLEIDNGHYHVNWDTDRCNTGACTLDPARTYRLRILSGAVELGHADLDVVATGNQLRNVNTDEYVPLKNGKTLPIRFRIEVGAVTRIPAGGSVTVGAAGARITTETASAALLIPPGAVTGSAAISIGAAPAGLPTLGSHATPIELGPDGQTFAQPVTLTLGFDPAGLPAGIPVTALSLVTWETDHWAEVPDQVLNETDNTISAPISHFSYYYVQILPNKAVPAGTAPPPLYVGQSTTVVANAYYVVHHGQVCYWRLGVRYCYNSSPVHYAVSGVKVAWESSQPLTVGIAPPAVSITANDGSTTSPVLVALTPGTSEIKAVLNGLNRPVYYSSPVPITVLPSLTFTVNASGTDPVRLLGFNQGTGLTVRVPTVTPADLTVTLTHSAPTVATSNPTVVITGGTDARGVGIRALTTAGVDTLIGTAPGYGPDTLIIQTGPGRISVENWPASIPFGDSVAIRIHPTTPDSSIIDNAYFTAFDLGSNGKLAFSRNGAAITSVSVPDGTSSSQVFYVKAIGSGTATMTVTNPHYVTNPYSTTVTAPPVINPFPQAGQQLVLPVLPGTSATAVAPISNAGGGVLTNLEVVGNPYVCTSGQQLGWLSFSFDAPTAPTNLRVTATVPAGTAYGIVDLCFTLRGQGAADRPYGVRVSVQEVVVANPPEINPFPQGRTQHSITVRAGESGRRDVPVSNTGGSPLFGLVVTTPATNCANGQPVTWLSHQWASTTAPTTLTLIATPPASVPAGTYELCFEIRARAAGAMDKHYGVNVIVQQAFTITSHDLGATGPGGSAALAVNPSGRIVGETSGSAAYWPTLGAALTLIPNPYGDLNSARDVNAAGLIAGRTPYVGWVFNPATGQFQTAPGPFAQTNRTQSHGINDNGQVLACAENGAFFQNYVWTLATGQTTLIPNAYNWCAGRINDGGLAVVSADPGAGGAGWLWNQAAGTVTVVPTLGGVTAAYDINASGVVVGSSRNAAGNRRAFRWDPAAGAPVDLGTLGGLESEARGISATGWIVGWSLTATGERHAFARNPVSGWMYDLGPIGGYGGAVANDVNDALDVVGFSENGSATRATRWKIQ